MLSNSSSVALSIRNVSHRYGQLTALDNLSLDVPHRSIFGVLGPNGSGKSTLFRLIATLTQVQEGSIEVDGHCTRRATDLVRQQLGVVFQSASLDRKLTVLENIRCQAALYGLSGKSRDARIDELIALLGLKDKLHERTEKLSGGQKRRVEIAKGLLHRPSVLLLDEPSTGIDPAARLDLWHALVQLRDEQGTTVLLTTHLLEEADKCDRLAILHRGQLVANDTPDALRAETGEMIISITSPQPQQLVQRIREEFSLPTEIVDDQVRIQTPQAMNHLAAIVSRTQSLATHVTVGRPSLEDVFIAKTGHQFHRS